MAKDSRLVMTSCDPKALKGRGHPYIHTKAQKT